MPRTGDDRTAKAPSDAAASRRRASWWSRTRGRSPTPSGTTSNARGSPCRWPPTGRRALARFREEQPALVILDLMLPELSGLDVCRTIRAESDVPIIIVTAKDSEADKVTGLEIGADDYVTKPFSIRELVSRVRAHLRRAGMRSDGRPRGRVLRGGPVELDVARHEVLVGGAAVVASRPRSSSCWRRSCVARAGCSPGTS